MNERIKELAIKAGVTFDWDPGTNGPEVYFDRQEYFEKFAELIVRECLTIVKLTHSEGNGDNYSYDDALNHVEYNMKEHFKKDATGNFCSIDPK